MPNSAPSSAPCSSRCAWVDAARVLAIVIVASSHQYLGGFGLCASGYCTGAAVALFFFLAGYFSKSTEVATCLKRTLAIFICYLFWATLDLCFAWHSFDIPLGVFWRNIWENSGVYWFLRHLCFASLVGIVFARMPRAMQLGVLIALFYYGSTYQPPCIIRHPFLIFPLSLSAFLCGVGSCEITLPRLGRLALPVPEKALPFAFALLLAFIGLAMVASLAKWPCQAPILLSILIAWGLLALCVAAGSTLPRCCAAAAAAGPAVVLFYVLHHPAIHAYTGVWVRLSGDYPPLWFDVLFLAAAMIACTWLTRKLKAKKRIVDIILFAR